MLPYRNSRIWSWTVAVLLIGLCRTGGLALAETPEFRLATFSADVTIPIGHRCMGVLPTKSQAIADPLEAHGFALLGAGDPVVFVAVDWCEIRNGAYDQWRDALAAAAGTSRERVLVCALHQHDAPVVDAGAARLLREAGLPGELYDEAFHASAIEGVVAALRESLRAPASVTHLGVGDAAVEKVASNRRVVHEDGRISFSRGSRSGGDPFFSAAPDGEIDPLVKTLSFWNEETPVAAVSVYATHPMSRYGAGIVSADFVGLARRRRQKETPGCLQIYASGCSGDVTAGKYNDGSDECREELIERLCLGMEAAWEQTERSPLRDVSFRTTPLQLEFYDHAELKAERLQETLADASARTEDRILAAMGLSSRERVRRGQPIDLSCLDFGAAKLVLFPGESFVGYQLMAQEMAPESEVLSVGYGECWPGYIPMDAAFADGFHDKWLWVAPGSERRVRAGLGRVLFEQP
ncbi:MAG: hypothetical protein KDA75_10350 [Planctomycetaceae bacterium]|nr:hypothetical protein [Planctomycetaceae bacterium]